MSISAFFDESGKFSDHDVITFCGIASQSSAFNGSFAKGWQLALDQAGIDVLSMKNALNYRLPLSAAQPSLGIENRIHALLPFIRCIRTHLEVITGAALDVKTFKKLPPHYFQVLGTDPTPIAFLVALLQVLKLTPDQDHISLICDDEEQMALPMYRVYRRVQKVWPDATKKLRAISFADDRYVFVLQAADLISSVMRMEAGRHFFEEQREYAPLFDAVTARPGPHEKICNAELAFCTKDALKAFADAMKLSKNSEQGTE